MRIKYSCREIYYFNNFYVNLKLYFFEILWFIMFDTIFCDFKIFIYKINIAFLMFLNGLTCMFCLKIY